MYIVLIHSMKRSICGSKGNDVLDMVYAKEDGNIYIFREDTMAHKIVKALKWEGLIYEICALSNQGTDILCQNLMSFLEEQEERESNFPELAEEERLEQLMMQRESRSYIDSLGCNEPLIDSSKDSLANLLSDVKRKDYS